MIEPQTSITLIEAQRRAHEERAAAFAAMLGYIPRLFARRMSPRAA